MTDEVTITDLRVLITKALAIPFVAGLCFGLAAIILAILGLWAAAIVASVFTMVCLVGFGILLPKAVRDWNI